MCLLASSVHNFKTTLSSLANEQTHTVHVRGDCANSRNVNLLRYDQNCLHVNTARIVNIFDVCLTKAWSTTPQTRHAFNYFHLTPTHQQCTAGTFESFRANPPIKSQTHYVASHHFKYQHFASTQTRYVYVVIF